MFVQKLAKTSELYAQVKLDCVIADQSFIKSSSFAMLRAEILQNSTEHQVNRFMESFSRTKTSF